MDGAGPAVIQLIGVRKAFPGAREDTIKGVSLDLRVGEVLAILGPSGCGKTTTLRLIAGFERPDSGQVLVRQRLVAGPSLFVPPERRGVGMLFQDYALFPHLTVGQNVAFGLQGRDRESRRRRVDEVLDLVALAGLDARYPHQLSGGQQQRVGLARALAPGPAAVLLDEPFSNLDAAMRAEVRRDVHQVLRVNSTAAILVTHDREEALSLADRVAVMVSGRIEQVGAPAEIYNHPHTLEVARLVGPADFLPGRSQGESVVTELGTLVCSAPGGAVTPGTELRVMLRPWQIVVADQESGGAGDGVSATVVEQEFRGPEILYILRLPSGRLLHSPRRPDSPLPTGGEVRVTVRPGTVAVAF